MHHRITAASLIAASAAAALALCAAPASAAATITKITVESPSGSSAKYGTGCSYEVTATVTGEAGQVILFYDVTETALGQQATKFYEVSDSSGNVTAKWTPTTTGNHTILVQEGDSLDTSDIIPVLSKGTNLGSSCVVLPDSVNGFLGNGSFGS